MITLFDFTIIAVISLAAFFDLEWRRIPNWLILLGLIAGLGLNGIRGLNEFYLSLLGFALGIALFFIPFAFRWLGAGDVKYLGVIGAFLGPYLLPRVLWYSVVVSGLMAIVSLASRHFNIRFAGELLNNIKHALLVIMTMGRLQIEPLAFAASTRAATVPWGVGISLGTLVAYYLDPTGRWVVF